MSAASAEVSPRLPAARIPRLSPCISTSPRSALLLVMMVIGMSLLPAVYSREAVRHSCWIAAATLSIGVGVLQFRVSRERRALLCVVGLKKAHYVQSAMQLCIYAYWGAYWKEVYRFSPLILAQLAFAYALDMLVWWSRRDRWAFGLGLIPIVLSINLFMWFVDEWFLAQFVVIACAVLGKEFVTWERFGRRTHIFNPSALALSAVSVCLILTQSTALIRAGDIAFTFAYPPAIYLAILLVGLVVQALFSVTLVTLASVAAIYAPTAAYSFSMGVPLFPEGDVPPLLFLGAPICSSPIPRPHPGQVRENSCSECSTGPG